jgi:hypothetical protein
MNKARGDFAAEALPGGRIIVMGGETTNGTATGEQQTATPTAFSLCEAQSVCNYVKLSLSRG